MAPLHCHLRLIAKSARCFKHRAGENRARLGIDQQLRNAGRGQPLGIDCGDLSHVGLQFGEPRPVDDQRRMDVERIDRELLAKYVAGDPEEFLSAVRWNKNPTRWCSVGNMAAALQLLQPDAVELVDYRQACDDRGFALVSSAAIAMMGEP